MRLFFIIATLLVGVVFLLLQEPSFSPDKNVSESPVLSDPTVTMDQPTTDVLLPKPLTLTSYVYEEIQKNVPTGVGDLVVTFTTDPEFPTDQDHVSMLWSVTDATGNPVDVDPVMHTNLMHTYVMPTTLSDVLFHNHPNAEANPGFWTGYTGFPSGGEWIAFFQFAIGETVYNVATKFPVVSDVAQIEAVQFERVSFREDSGVQVTLQAPDVIRVGEPASFLFQVEGIENASGEYYVSHGHNVILAKEYEQGQPIRMWNIHGDRSVEDVSSLFGIDVVRKLSAEQPFDYTLTFHETGRWLVQFEVEDAPFEFFIEAVE